MIPLFFTIMDLINFHIGKAKRNPSGAICPSLLTSQATKKKNPNYV